MKSRIHSCSAMLALFLLCVLPTSHAFGDVLSLMDPVQSSTVYRGFPARATDGDTNGAWTNRSVTHTRNESEAWWSAELLSTSLVSDITIWNRTGCCTTRLSDFYVFVSDSPFASTDVTETLNDSSVWSSFHSGAVEESVSIPVDAVGRYVRIQLQGTNPLSLAEVEVSGTLQGTLPLTSAMQSSIGFSGVPERAIDGDSSGVWRNGSVTHTANKSESWWSAELDALSEVTDIRIWNRTDSCCTSRLSDFYVFVSDSPFASDDVAETLNDSSVWSSFHNGAVDGSVLIPVDAVGQYVRIQLKGTGFLSLAEVLVYGELDEGVTPLENIPPVAVDDSDVTVEIGNSVTIAVLLNDSDVDGTLNASSVVTSLDQAVPQPDGTVVYTPEQDADSLVSFTYTVEDDDGAISNTGTVTVSVTSPVIAPLAVDDSVDENGESLTVDIGQPLTIAVLSNDIERDSALDVSSVVTSLNLAVAQQDGTIVYTPAAGTNTNYPVSFTYTVQDAEGTVSNAATVTVHVTTPNVAPVAVDDNVNENDEPLTVEVSQSLTIDVLSNDIERDGTLIVSSVVTSLPDDAVAQPDGTIKYTPEQGTDTDEPVTFTYTVVDDDGAISNAATVTVTVTLPNIAPVAADDSFDESGEPLTVDIDQPLTIAVLSNDSDTDGTLNVSSVVTSLDEAIAQEDGTIEYTPAPGTDTENPVTFTYTVEDNDGAISNAATVTINVSPANIAPVAMADSVDANDEPLTVDIGQPLTIAVLGNDSDSDGNLDVSSVVTSLDEAIAQEDGTIEYTPALGTDTETPVTFTYTVEDDDGAISNAATVTVNVSPANIAPVAMADSVDANDEPLTVDIGQSLTIAVLGNDSDSDGDLDVSSVVTSLDEAIAQEDGTIEYTPALGTDTDAPVTFTYTVEDDDGAISNAATVTVLVTVAANNVAPVAVDDSVDENDEQLTVHIGKPLTIAVLFNDSDTDGTLNVSSVVTSLDEAIAQEDGTIEYTPALGTDTETPVTFTYTVEDNDGGISNAATVTVYVSPANIAPVAVDDSVDINDEPLIAEIDKPLTIDVLGNDGDSDGTLNTSSVLTSLAQAVAQEDGTIVYTPAAGTDTETPVTFTYTVKDDDGDISNTATVTVSVIVANEEPFALDDSVDEDGETFRVEIGQSLTIVVLNNDTDDDGTLIANSVVTSLPDEAIAQPDGTIVYTPLASTDTESPVTFTYTVEDDRGAISNAATVTVTVAPGATIDTHHETIPNPVYGSDFRVAASCIGSEQACDWGSSSTWLTGTIPDSDSLVVIDGHVQIRDLNAVAQSVAVYSGGKLTFATNSDTQLEVADLLVLSGSVLEIGSSDAPIGDSNSSELVFRDLPFDANDTAQHLRGLLALGGVMRVHGRALNEVYLRTAIEPESGDSEITFGQSALAAGWKVGDEVVIPTSAQCAYETRGYCEDQTEDRTITSISDNGFAITLNEALDYAHPGARDHNGLLDFTPHIINMSRNVVFRSENPEGTRGHLLLHGRADVDLRYAEINSLGRTDINDLGTTNQKGRYPVHAHHLIGPVAPQDNGYQYSFVGNTIDFGTENTEQNRKWGVAIHGSHYGLIERNVVDNASGAAVVTETGAEMGNMFSENFVVRVIGGNGERLHDADPSDGSKLGRAGTGYWFNGGGFNFYFNNIAAAIAECTHCFGFKFDNMYNGDLVFPSVQGADPYMSGGDTITASTIGLNSFSGNEAYAVPNGITMWWLCTYAETAIDNCSSYLDSFQVWHNHRWGVFAYETSNMTLDSFVLRGDPAILINQYEKVTGLEFSDYMSLNVTISGADIQNVRTAIEMPSHRDTRGATGSTAGITTVEDSYLVATIGVNVMVPASVTSAADLSPQTTVVRNVEFVSIDPGNDFDAAHVQYSDSTYFLTNPVVRNDVLIYSYNGVAGDDLYLVPEYQGHESCDDSIGICISDISANYEYIREAHIYPLR